MKTLDYKEELYKRLKNDPKLCAAYLNEALSDEDMGVFFLALKDVIEARSTITKVAQTADMNREHLYKIFSNKGNPTSINLIKILQSVGLQISIQAG